MNSMQDARLKDARLNERMATRNPWREMTSLKDELDNRWNIVRCDYDYPHIAQRIQQSPPLLNDVPLWKAFYSFHLDGDTLEFTKPASATAAEETAWQASEGKPDYSPHHGVVHIPPFTIPGFEVGPVARELGVEDLYCGVYEATTEWLIMGRLQVLDVIEHPDRKPLYISTWAPPTALAG